MKELFFNYEANKQFNKPVALKLTLKFHQAKTMQARHHWKK